MNRRGFLKSAAGAFAGIMAGGVIAPLKPAIAKPLIVAPKKIAAPVFRDVVFKCQDLTGYTRIHRSLLADGNIENVNNAVEKLFQKALAELAND